jgi:thioredoxin 1
LKKGAITTTFGATKTFERIFPMATVKVDKSNFQADVLNAKEPVVVDFWAEWCGPCKMIAPALEEIAIELGGKVKIAKLNIDENPELAAQFGVRSIPTLMIFKGGEMADIKVGAAPKTALSHWINGSLA